MPSLIIEEITHVITETRAGDGLAVDRIGRTVVSSCPSLVLIGKVGPGIAVHTWEETTKPLVVFIDGFVTDFFIDPGFFVLIIDRFALLRPYLGSIEILAVE